MNSRKRAAGAKAEQPQKSRPHQRDDLTERAYGIIHLRDSFV
jgi:hypothetical protein